MKDVKTIYKIRPLLRASRETVYKRLSGEISASLGFPVAIHGDSTSGLTATYNLNDSAKANMDSIDISGIVALAWDKHLGKPQNPLLQRAMAALQVLTLTEATQRFLNQTDPKGLAQANGVLLDMKAAGIISNPRP